MRAHAIRLLAGILAMPPCAPAFGLGVIGNATVDELLNDVAYPNLVFVSLNGSKTDSPACHTHTVWEFVLDISTQQGILQYTMLVSSLKDGLAVDLMGTGTCDLYSYAETLRRVELH